MTAFVGATPNNIRLHAATPTLGPGATQVVEGTIGKSPVKGFGTRLSVPDAPDLAGDVGALTAFQATLNKGVKATCKDKKIKTQAEFIYDDGSKDTADGVDPLQAEEEVVLPLTGSDERAAHGPPSLVRRARLAAVLR